MANFASQPWVHVLLGAVHIVGISLLLGNLALLELRVWGKAPDVPVKALARLGLWLIAVGFFLAAASGLLMFSARAAELLQYRVFTLKMLLLTALACNAAWFHGRGSLEKLDAVAKLQMAASSLLWVAVVVCGRFIAHR